MTIMDEQINNLMQWQNIKKFGRYFWGHLVEVNSIQSAAALAYTTLLSLVPLIAVSLSIFAAFPAFDGLSEQMQQFVFNNFVPAAGQVIQQNLNTFAEKAKQLTSVGIVVLLVTAIMMMATIEKSFNSIWQVSVNKSLLKRFVIYWSVLTLGPLMMGGGMAMTSYIISLPLFTESATRFGILRFVPFLLEVFTFTLLYLVVPNAKVKVSQALIGGLLAALLFELAKFCFTWYISHFPTYETIYGALATVPIFLIWVYLSWLVALIGAGFTYTLGAFQSMETGIANRNNESSSAHDLLLAYSILKQLWRAQDQGISMSVNDITTDHVTDDATDTVEDVLNTLSNAHLVTQDHLGRYLLSRNLNKYRLIDLYQSRAYFLPKMDINHAQFKAFGEGLRPILERVDDTVGDAMDKPLARLFELDSAENPVSFLVTKKNARAD